MVAIRIGPGQRTTAAPTLRQNRTRMARLGSRPPILLTAVTTAGPSVSAAMTTTSMPIASGIPRDLNIGLRVKCRQNIAPAIVSPEPRITCAVPWNIS